MTLKRQLGIAAVLVVVVGPRDGSWCFERLGRTRRPPATFVRYATNGVVIELVNHGASELAYV
jgi:hypothetical protein